VVNRRALYALLWVAGILSLAALACTSDQEWIIPRTAIPTATMTPVPVSSETEFQIGDRAVVVSDVFIVPLTARPERDFGGNRVVGGSCFPGTTVDILDVGQGPDGSVFYRVACAQEGWISQDNLDPVE
jgi:hypothetical protein